MSDTNENKKVAMQQDEQQAPDDTANWEDKDATAGDDPQKYIRTLDNEE
jgi:hypothetical protein